VLNYPEYLIVVVDKLDYCSSLNNLRPFLLFPGDQDDINGSHDAPTSVAPTASTATDSQIRWTQSTDTSYFNDSEQSYHFRRGNSHSNNDRWLNNPQYPNFVYFFGDITDVALIDFIMAKYRINTILHLAAQTHVDKSFGESIEFTQNNVLGTHVLLEAARKYFCKLPSRVASRKGQGNAYGQDQALGGDDDDEEQGDGVEKRFVFVSTDEVYGQCLFGQVCISSPLVVLLTAH
jgi:dTDP-D-glucose 4,6-dehydratase